MTWLLVRFGVRRSESLNQLTWIDTEAGGDLEQVMEAQVAPASLDLPQERPVDAATGSQGFLAEALGLSPAADALAKACGSWGDWLWHCQRNPIRPDYLCPERSRLMRLRPGTVPRYVGAAFAPCSTPTSTNKGTRT